MTKIFNKKEYTLKRKKLRKDIPEAELILWKKLKNKKINNCKFRRQYGIGRFVVDFYCPKLNLAIEVDGGSHTATQYLENKDKKRQKKIEKLGIIFLRFNNSDIYYNLNNVLDVIYEKTNELITSPSPLLRNEGE